MSKIVLPDRGTDAGLKVRVLLAEVPTPSFANWTLAAAEEAMLLMDAVLRNRVDDPKPFGASAKTLSAVVRAKGQFKGFENYPMYAAAIVQRIQAVIDIANKASDTRQPSFVAHLQAALARANASSFTDPSPGKLVGWRTRGSGTPSSKMTLFKSVLGNEFYYW